MNGAVSESRGARASSGNNTVFDLGALSKSGAAVQATQTQCTGFDYTALAPADAAELRGHAIRLRGLITKSTADMIKIGDDLRTIKGMLEHGQFVDWIERELGVGIRSAQLYMSVAKLAEGKSESVSLLPPSTARILAAKSAPPDIVKQVIESAGAGDLMTDVAVKSMIADDKAMRSQAKQEADRAKRKSKEGRAARARKAEAEEARRLAEQRRLHEERREKAQSIFDRFSFDDNAFLAATMTWDILDEYKLVVAEAGTP
jgi:hypothetical protein